MKCTIPDEKIKLLIQNCLEGDKSRYPSIVRMLTPYIYNYPRIVFGTDLDTCADFYEYILRRLEKILTKYSDTGARFVTWFTVVLRNRYLNYLRERRQSQL
jgi:RNA polymerase sigma factor (sigma-70 family)